MKRTLSTLAGAMLALSIVGAPMAFADTTGSSDSAAQSATSAAASGVDQATQQAADNTMQQVQNSVDQAGQSSTGDQGVQSAVGQSHLTKADRFRLLQALAEFRLARQNARAAHDQLKDAVQNFRELLGEAEQAGDKQLVLKGMEQAQIIRGILRNAVSDESGIRTDLNKARAEVRAGHVNAAITLIHDAVSKERAKAAAMRQAAESFRLLAADIKSHIQSNGGGSTTSTGTASGQDNTSGTPSTTPSPSGTGNSSN